MRDPQSVTAGSGLTASRVRTRRPFEVPLARPTIAVPISETAELRTFRIPPTRVRPRLHPASRRRHSAGPVLRAIATRTGGPERLRIVQCCCVTEIDLADEATMLGLCLIQCQRIELVLYGIAAHVTHLPAVATDGRFRNLDPEAFLRGDPRKLKATLGALRDALGDAVLLDKEELDAFVDDRNLLVHNYWRVFHWDINGAPRRTDAREFLLDFAARSTAWTEILNGLLTELLVAFAAKEGRSSEFKLTPDQVLSRAAYQAHVTQRLKKDGH